MKTYNPSQLRSDLFNIIKNVTKFGEPIEVITNNEENDKVIIIRKEDYESMEETLYLINNNVHEVVTKREEKGDYIDYDKDLWDTL